ncbi:MAG: hypothetical protein ACTHMM_26775 [Agriterribacter sp.]
MMWRSAVSGQPSAFRRRTKNQKTRTKVKKKSRTKRQETKNNIAKQKDFTPVQMASARLNEFIRAGRACCVEMTSLLPDRILRLTTYHIPLITPPPYTMCSLSYTRMCGNNFRQLTANGLQAGMWLELVCQTHGDDQALLQNSLAQYAAE